MTTTWDNLELTGTSTGGWLYNEVGLLYNSPTDPDTGESVYYNGIGVTSSWANPSVNSTTFANPSINSSVWTDQSII